MKRVNGWWCPKCECLMIIKKRRNGERIPCDCADVQVRPGSGPEWINEMRSRNLALVKRQRLWKSLWVMQ